MAEDKKSPLVQFREKLPEPYRTDYIDQPDIDHPDWQTSVGRYVYLLFTEAATKSLDQEETPVQRAGWHKRAMECLDYLLRIKTLETKQNDLKQRPGNMVLSFAGFDPGDKAK